MKKNRKEKSEPEIIAYLVHADGTFEFVNPCRVPIETLEKSIKEHKKKKPNKNEITSYALIKIPNIKKHGLKRKN